MESDKKEVGIERRRSFLHRAALTAAAVSTGLGRNVWAEPTSTVGSNTKVETRRKLGKLQVSSIGLGCQDFTGTFYATAPNRSDMIQLARNAHERGVTLFDMAEAYEPFEVERIVGEALKSVRREVIYSSKFGWDIDPETGRMRGGLNSRPEHIRVAVDGMLKRLQTRPSGPAVPTPCRSKGAD